MTTRVLFVDDNVDVLEAYERKLRGQVQLETAESGMDALQILQTRGPFSVIVADMRMPGMDGISLLKEVQRRHPSVVRLMLTGNMDQSTAVLAMNEGHVYRYLTKPCETPTLIRALDDAHNHYKTVQVERELLTTTVRGVVTLLFEVLSQADPEAWSRALTIKRYATQIASFIPTAEGWEVELSALLCRLGEVTIPRGLLYGTNQSPQDRVQASGLLEQVPEQSAKLLSHIPRFEELVEYVRYHDKGFDGSGLPADDVRGEALPLISRILKLAIDLTRAVESGIPNEVAYYCLEQHAAQYDPALLKITRKALLGAEHDVEQEDAMTIDDTAVTEPQSFGLLVEELRVGMCVVETVLANNGVTLIRGNTVLSEVMLERIRNYHEFTGVQEPIRVTFNAPADAATG